MLAAEVILAAEVMAAEADRADPNIETTATTQARALRACRVPDRRWRGSDLLLAAET
ncbi:MAG: hypothetical protein K0S72_1912 [Arthrobacter sp.]|nr:hypothetical protein [Arthrobacter sp.]